MLNSWGLSDHCVHVFKHKHICVCAHLCIYFCKSKVMKISSKHVSIGGKVRGTKINYL
uniref:Uncharacterized protein n=1 Tax=Rhizophora mucronata TaxID=61149 RepID=A0A2P2NTW2_RHIMU